MKERAPKYFGCILIEVVVYDNTAKALQKQNTN
jgi:hypothetical protein